MKTTVEISERYRISYRNAAIVAPTEVLGASVHSENLNNKQLIGGVTIVIPFHS
jgi:predicted nucleic acid-binding protein